MSISHLVRGLSVSVVCLISLFCLLVADETSYVVFPLLNSQPIPECGPNEMFKMCKNMCPTCEERGICKDYALGYPKCEAGCDCLQRFVRLEPGGPCESVAMCPRPTSCGENEVFRSCGPVCERCYTLRCRVVACNYKCYCREGYRRDFEGVCVPDYDCPPRFRCPSAEEQRDSGPVDEYCQQPESDPELANRTQEKEACYCKEGRRRNAMGHCTFDTLCKYVTCPENMEYQQCPRNCNNTCRNYGDDTCEEDDNCYPGCFCTEDKLMNDNGRCVKPEECPPGSNPHLPTALPTTPEPTTESETDSTVTIEDFTTTTKPETSSTAIESTLSTIASTQQTSTVDQSQNAEDVPTDDTESASETKSEDDLSTSTITSESEFEESIDEEPEEALDRSTQPPTPKTKQSKLKGVKVQDTLTVAKVQNKKPKFTEPNDEENE